jgi:hypothetical protein
MFFSFLETGRMDRLAIPVAATIGCVNYQAMICDKWGSMVRLRMDLHDGLAVEHCDRVDIHRETYAIAKVSHCADHRYTELEVVGTEPVD